MLRRIVVQLVSAAALLSASSLAQAQCGKDTDCKGERICDSGRCTAPRSRAGTSATAPASAAAANAAGQVPPVSSPLAVPARAPAPADVPLPPADVPPPKMRRHSPGMMAGGIVMVSLAPAALAVSGVAALIRSACELSHDDGYDTGDDDCDDYNPTIYGGLVSALVLVGVGVPLIVVGAKKEPVEAMSATAVISPWVGPAAAGVSLRVEL